MCLVDAKQAFLQRCQGYALNVSGPAACIPTVLTRGGMVAARHAVMRSVYGIRADSKSICSVIIEGALFCTSGPIWLPIWGARTAARTKADG